MHRPVKERLIKPIGWLILTLFLNIAATREAIAYELTLDLAFDIAVDAYQKTVWRFALRATGIVNRTQRRRKQFLHGHDSLGFEEQGHDHRDTEEPP